MEINYYNGHVCQIGNNYLQVNIIEVVQEKFNDEINGGQLNVLV